MVEAIVEADYVGRTVIQSFHLQALETIYDLNPDIQVCPLYGLWRFSLSGPQPGEAKLVCPMAEMVIRNPWMLKQAHVEGRQTFVWFGVIEHPVVMQFLLTLGTDGLMVDDTRTLADILKR